MLLGAGLAVGGLADDGGPAGIPQAGGDDLGGGGGVFIGEDENVGDVRPVALGDDVPGGQPLPAQGVPVSRLEKRPRLRDQVRGDGKGQVQAAAGVVPQVQDQAGVPQLLHFQQAHAEQPVAAVVGDAAPFHVIGALGDMAAGVVALHQRRAGQGKGQLPALPQHLDGDGGARLATEQVGDVARRQTGQGDTVGLDEHVVHADTRRSSGAGEVDIYHQSALGMGLDGDAHAHIAGLGVKGGGVAARGHIPGIGVVARKHFGHQLFIQRGVLLQGADQGAAQRIVFVEAFQPLLADEGVQLQQDLILLFRGIGHRPGAGRGAQQQADCQQKGKNAVFHGMLLSEKRAAGPPLAEKAGKPRKTGLSRKNHIWSGAETPKQDKAFSMTVAVQLHSRMRARRSSGAASLMRHSV